MKTMTLLKLLLDVYRPLRWYRNLFMLLGAVLAFNILNYSISSDLLIDILWGFVAICFVASGNYGINEILDAESDRHNPKKKFRAIPSGKLSVPFVLVLSLVFYGLGIGVTFIAEKYFLTGSVLLLFISGIVYNVKPIRIKDLPYVDFIGEALNNPIRLLVGWYAVAAPNEIVPTSFLLSFWFLGIFLMAAKRFGEIRHIASRDNSVGYRKSFKYYSEQKILIAMIASLSAFSCMFGALCMKHSIDMMLLLPLLIIFVIWFFNLAYQENTIVKDPERIFEKKGFLFYSVFLVFVFFYLLNTGDQILGFIK